MLGVGHTVRHAAQDPQVVQAGIFFGELLQSFVSQADVLPPFFPRPRLQNLQASHSTNRFNRSFLHSLHLQ